MDLDTKLISALIDLRRTIKKNIILKEEVNKLKECLKIPNRNIEETNQTIINPKVQLQEE